MDINFLGFLFLYIFLFLLLKEEIRRYFLIILTSLFIPFIIYLVRFFLVSPSIPPPKVETIEKAEVVPQKSHLSTSLAGYWIIIFNLPFLLVQFYTFSEIFGGITQFIFYLFFSLLFLLYFISGFFILLLFFCLFLQSLKNSFS